MSATVIDDGELKTLAVGQFQIKSDTVTPLDVADEFTPEFLQTMEDLDVDPGFLADLALKTVSLDADCTTARVAQRLRVGISLTNKLLEQLVAEKLIEKKGMAALCNYRYEMLERGWAKVDRLMKVCSYVGPAPVSLKTYTEMITGQVRARRPVPRAVMERALSRLLLSETTKQALRLVSSSGSQPVLERAFGEWQNGDGPRVS